MIAPLGPHVSDERRVRKGPRPRPMATSYALTVWVFTDERGDAARFRLHVRIPNAASVDDAMDLCWSQYGAQQRALAAAGPAAEVATKGPAATTPSGAPCAALPDPARPPGEYIIMPTYADGRIDAAQPFLSRPDPLAPQLAFPFLVALCPDPFVLRLDALRRREEEKRADIIHKEREAPLGALYILQYAALLRGVAHGAHAQGRRDDEARRRLKLRERADYYAAREVELWREEQESRARCEGGEGAGRGLLRALLAAVLAEVAGRAGGERGGLGALAALRAAAARELAELRLVARLRGDAAALRRLLSRGFDAAARRKRMHYADSRVASTLRAAGAQGVSPYAQQQLRAELLLCARAGAAEAAPPGGDLCDVDAVGGDEWSSTWLRLSAAEACGGATLRRRRLSVGSLSSPPRLLHSHPAAPAAALPGCGPLVRSPSSEPPPAAPPRPLTAPAPRASLLAAAGVARRKPYLAPGRQPSVAATAAYAVRGGGDG